MFRSCVHWCQICSEVGYSGGRCVQKLGTLVADMFEVEYTCDRCDLKLSTLVAGMF
jgi:hypothetical protein